MSRKSSSKSPSAATETREVSNMLHTLRGEQFRHAQNLRRSQAHIKQASSRHTYNNPTLPLSQIFGSADADSETAPVAMTDPRRARPPVVLQEGILQYAYPDGRVPGVPPPKSWSPLFEEGKGRDKENPAWRAHALALTFAHLPWSPGSSETSAFIDHAGRTSDEGHSNVSPLTLTCLKVLLAVTFPSEFAEDVVPYLPVHLRRDLLRWTAIHSPLSNARLSALCEPDGHAAGELILVGPYHSIRSDHFKDKSRDKPFVHRDEEEGSNSGGPLTPAPGTPQEATVDDMQEDWDDESSFVNMPPPLTALMLANTPLPTHVLFALPPTLTHLALLALPSPAPVYRLTRICPLLEVLDLSFNAWLGPSQSDGGGDRERNKSQMGGEMNVLERVEWRRWTHLKVLGLRECGVQGDIVKKVNQGRWVDVEVVGVGRTDNLYPVPP